MRPRRRRAGDRRSSAAAVPAALVIAAAAWCAAVPAADAPPPHRIDPAVAGAAEWSVLPGIGPARAAAVLDDRVRHGPVRDASELVRVPGIGPRTAAAVARHLRIAPARPPAAPRGDEARTP